jgi:DNA mismatch endonuclease (patch repair protein)
MQGNRRRDTAPELAVRRLLHASGCRYRVDIQPLPDLRRRADIVFTRQKIAVFIDGCYWHGCPVHGSTPQTNSEYWSSKVAANRARDADTNARLSEAGWHAARYWEHEQPSAVAADVLRLLARPS